MARILLALLFFFKVAGAFAQAPPPVPALPDTERRTAYNITSSVCTCSVNFALYGDGTDYQNWIDVWLNGVQVQFNDPNHGWTISSPTGPLGNIARPITDASLSFNAAQTGTVEIVGARRPRRTTTFSENQGVTARSLNQSLNDIIAQNREEWDKTNDLTGRGLFFAPGYTTGPMPAPVQCGNSYLGFDATGLNPVCFLSLQQPTLPLAVVNGGTGNTTFLSNLPLIGNGGSAIAQGTRSGNTTDFATTTGTLTNGHCVSIDSNGNLIDAGGACTTGGGGGTVSSATSGQLGFYAVTGNTISGTNAGTGVVTALGNAVNSSGGVSLAGKYSRIVGFNAAANMSSPTTAMVFNATSIDFYNPTTGVVEKTVVSPTANLACVINTFGAGGRDQSGAFAGGDTVYAYYIWGSGPGVNCIWSKSGPPTGPTLPATYTSWAYAFPVVFFGSATLEPTSATSGVSTYAVTDHEVLFQGPFFINLGSGFPSYTYNLGQLVPATAFLTEFIMDAENHASAAGPVISGFVCSYSNAFTLNYCNISLYPQTSWWSAQDNFIRVNLRAASLQFYGEYQVSGGVVDNANTFIQLVGYTF